MATRPNGEANGCTFQWKIENLSQIWWMKTAEGIDSPKFIADAVEGTKWSLSLYPLGYTDEKTVGVLLKREKDCSGPNVVEVFFQLALLGKDGLTLRGKIALKTGFKAGENRGFPRYLERETIFGTEREIFLPEDTVTVQCKIWNKESTPVKLPYLYALTTLKVNRRYFVWRIDNFSTLKPGLRKKFKDNLIDFDLVINESLGRLEIDIVSAVHNIKYISYSTWILNTKGKKVNCGIKKYFTGDFKKGISTLVCPGVFMENKVRYIQNDVLTLYFDFVFSTVEHFDYRKNSYYDNEPCVVADFGKEKYRITRVLTEDLKSMNNDGIFSHKDIVPRQKPSQRTRS